MTNAEKLLKIIEENEDLANMYGSIQYSSVDTLKKGKFYFLGLNPGGEPSGNKTVKDNFNTKYMDNSYLDEEWSNKKEPNPGKGESFLQRNIKELFFSLGEKNLREVCASNLIFKQSASEGDIKSDIKKLADTCFVVHKWIIEEIVKPEFIIVMSKLALDYFVKHQGYKITEEFASGYSNWKVRVAKNEKNSNTLIYIPHMSFYDPNRKQHETAMKRVKELVKK